MIDNLLVRMSLNSLVRIHQTIQSIMQVTTKEVTLVLIILSLVEHMVLTIRKHIQATMIEHTLEHMKVSSQVSIIETI